MNLFSLVAYLLNSPQRQSYNVTTYDEFNDLDSRVQLAIDIFYQIDRLIRVLSTLVHLFYFVLIFKIKELQTRNLFYVHHANLVSFLFNLHYMLYFRHVKPSFESSAISELACDISELLWAMLKILRTYSIALIAFYRLIAVYRINLFNQFNQSMTKIFVPLVLTYVWATFIILTTKLAFNTTHGYFYCYDGYSERYSDSLKYFIVNVSVGIVLPTGFVIVAYIFIRRKLEHSKSILAKNIVSNRAKLVENKEASSDHRQKGHVCLPKRPLPHKRLLPRAIQISRLQMSLIHQRPDSTFNQNMSKQFILMNSCEIVSCLSILAQGIRFFFPILNEYYILYRFILRTVNILFQSMVPILAIVYNPIIVTRLKRSLNLI